MHHRRVGRLKPSRNRGWSPGQSNSYTKHTRPIRDNTAGWYKSWSLWYPGPFPDEPRTTKHGGLWFKCTIHLIKLLISELSPQMSTNTAMDFQQTEDVSEARRHTNHRWLLCHNIGEEKMEARVETIRQSATIATLQFLDTKNMNIWAEREIRIAY